MHERPCAVIEARHCAVRVSGTALVCLIFNLAPVDDVHSSGAPTATEAGLKVAFVADTGAGPSFRSVLELIRDQGADMVLHQGDLGYRGRSPTAFVSAVDQVLGPDFPYFASRGNHDIDWGSGYQPVLRERAERAGAVCKGDYGQNSSCRFRGLFFILSAGGERGPVSRNTDYLRDHLAADNSIWRVCSWHHNQRTMQVGGKWDEVGRGPYQACAAGGAIIATGHGHYYARTRTLDDIEKLRIRSECNNTAGDALCVVRGNEAAGESGATFVFVSGLGGRQRRPQRRCLPTRFPYGQGRGCRGIWAKIYSSSQGARHGALFITFGSAGDPYKATGEFINVDGEVVDSFTVHRLKSRETGD